LVFSFEKQCQKEFLGSRVQRENYSWPKGRKKLNDIGLDALQFRVQSLIGIVVDIRFETLYRLNIPFFP
jgi:hypothetical protein